MSRIVWLRIPKTTQESRENSSPDTEQFVRGKRKNLPEYFDDLVRKPERSWKRHRLTRWKPQRKTA